MPDLPLGVVIAFDRVSWNINDEIDLLNRVGVDRVQIYRNYAQNISADFVRRTLDEADLVCDSLHGYFRLEESPGPSFDPSSGDPAVRASALEIMRLEADYAHALGCRDIVVHPSEPDSRSDQPFREAALRESVEALAQLGKKADVRFLLENMPPPMFGSDARVLRRLADQVNDPHIALVYDSGHAMLAHEPVEFVRIMGPRLALLHLHDNKGEADDHLIPGMGILPFEDVAGALAEVGYSGTFLLEVYRQTEEVRRDLTTVRLAFIEHLRRLASGYES
jgi:sugar phosphate isomerase/epimerase